MDNKSFEDMLAEVKRTRKEIKTSPKVATDYLQVARRGWRVNERVQNLLEKYDVVCEPAFDTVWLYGEITIRPKPKAPAIKGGEVAQDLDPTPRLSRLTAANLQQAKENGVGKGLVSVTRDTLLTEAITLMIMNDFSQLPILSGRQAEGIVSWRSIGRAFALKKECHTVSDCKEDIEVLKHDMPLFEAVKVVLRNEVVLVKQRDNTISGIVTATDIGEEFISLAEPFLLIEQIENHVRKLLHDKFGLEELKAIKPNVINTGTKEITALSDLTFGDYVWIFKDPEKFSKIGLNVDRAIIADQLDEVRKIRNEVMHFDPDRLNDNKMATLRESLSFLLTIENALKPKK